MSKEEIIINEITKDKGALLLLSIFVNDKKIKQKELIFESFNTKEFIFSVKGYDNKKMCITPKILLKELSKKGWNPICNFKLKIRKYEKYCRN